MASQVTSTQTNYPTRPDTSMDAYYDEHGRTSPLSRSALGRFFNTFLGPDPTYNQWRNERLDKYNADLQAYNSYITSLAGQKVQALEAGYNPAWLDSASGGGTSPLDYQSAPDPAEQVPDSISSLFGSVRTLLGVASGAQDVASKHIQNDILRSNAQIKRAEAAVSVPYFRSRASRMGFLSDWQQIMNEDQLYGQFGDLGDQVVHYGNSDYVLDRFIPNRLSYQKGVSEIDFLKAGKDVRKAQKSLFDLKASEQKYFNDNIQPLIKEYTEGKKSYQDTVNAYYEEMKKNEMNNRTVNTISRIFFGLLNVASRVFLGTNIVDVDAATGEVTGERQVRPTLP